LLAGGTANLLELSGLPRLVEKCLFRTVKAQDDNPAFARPSLHPIGFGERARTLQVDMMAYDEADKTIRAYEVKRGNGQFDAGKIRSLKRDLMCVQVLLKSYAETAKVAPVAAEAKIIFYYGIRSIPRPWSLVREDLDGHFGFPIVEKVEQANGYFRERLHELLEAA
jgi:hypothetical protein